MASPLTPRTVRPAPVPPVRSHPTGEATDPLAGPDPLDTDPLAGLRPLPPESPLDRLRRWIARRSLSGQDGFGIGRVGLPDAVGGRAPQPGPAVAAGRFRGAASLAAVAVTLGVGWWLVRPPAAPLESVLPVAEVDGGTVPPGAGGGTTPAGAAPAPAPGDPTADPAAAGGPTTLPELVVQAAGAVGSPGVYRLAPGARVDDLIRAAGGVAPDADADRVNLAAPLTDGERVWVPRRGETEVPSVVAGGGPPPAPSGGGTAGGGGAPPGEPAIVDLNTATAEELDSLPGVGPATATAILTYRDSNGPFSSVDELLEVRGIGEAKLEQLRPLVRV